MPTFNRAWIMRRAIDSVLAQTYRNFELIVVDDASTDDTAAVMADYSDQRLKYHHLDTNSGPAGARNAAFEQAQGELIAYLDTDNVWHATYLEVMAAELRPSRVLAYSNQNLLLIEGSRASARVVARRTRREAYEPGRLLEGNYIDLNAVIHRHDLIAEIGPFDADLTSLEDWDLIARAAIRHPLGIHHVDQVLGDYYYYLGSASPTVTNSHFQEADLRRVFGGPATDAQTSIVYQKLKTYQEAQ